MIYMKILSSCSAPPKRISVKYVTTMLQDDKLCRVSYRQLGTDDSNFRWTVIIQTSLLIHPHSCCKSWSQKVTAAPKLTQNSNIDRGSDWPTGEWNGHFAPLMTLSRVVKYGKFIYHVTQKNITKIKMFPICLWWKDILLTMYFMSIPNDTNIEYSNFDWNVSHSIWPISLGLYAVLWHRIWTWMKSMQTEDEKRSKYIITIVLQMVVWNKKSYLKLYFVSGWTINYCTTFSAI